MLDTLNIPLGESKGEAFCGSTNPGKTDWKEYRNQDGDPIGIYVDVDTRVAGFTSTPIYFTSIGGFGGHFAIIGATSIYRPAKDGFRIYIKSPGIVHPSPQFANERHWHINWIGYSRSSGCGSTPIGNTDWKEFRNQDGDLLGIYVDVKTEAPSKQIYFTSIGGFGGHFIFIGATSIYRPTKDGFRIYMKSPGIVHPTPQFANELQWHINWRRAPKNNQRRWGWTPVGNTDWKEYRNQYGDLLGIYVDVDTRAAGFTSTPIYFTSIGGFGGHFAFIGATSIYRPTKDGFRIYMKSPGIVHHPTPQFANERQWHINWHGMNLELN